jgi:hypothetical protein
MKRVVVASALKGCHFENTTALNYPKKKGDNIKGFRGCRFNSNFLEMSMH